MTAFSCSIILREAATYTRYLEANVGAVAPCSSSMRSLPLHLEVGILPFSITVGQQSECYVAVGPSDIHRCLFPTTHSQPLKLCTLYRAVGLCHKDLPQLGKIRFFPPTQQKQPDICMSLFSLPIPGPPFVWATDCPETAPHATLHWERAIYSSRGGQGWA